MTEASFLWATTSARLYPALASLLSSTMICMGATTLKTCAAIQYDLTYNGPDTDATFTLADDKTRVDCGAATRISAGTTISCTSRYVVVDSDLSAAGVTNTATFTVTDLFGTREHIARANVAPTAALPWHENMDSFDLCTASCGATCSLPTSPLTLFNDASGADDTDWTVHSGATLSSCSGPNGDHTAPASGKYLFIEANLCSHMRASVVSPVFDLRTVRAPISLSFWYHMYGSGMGRMHVDTSIDGGITWASDLTPPMIGEQQTAQSDEYKQWSIDLDQFIETSQFRVRVRGQIFQ